MTLAVWVVADAGAGAWGPVMIKITINDAVREVDADPDMPLLWVIRDVIEMTGTERRFHRLLLALLAPSRRGGRAAVPKVFYPVLGGSMNFLRPQKEVLSLHVAAPF
jgi:hypothetical protein